jgi:hypothetical protein
MMKTIRKTTHDDRWEHGSELHLFPYEQHRMGRQPWSAVHRTYASGRDAFHALLCHGQAQRGWKRLLVPSYYCQKVVDSLARSGIEIALYDDGPDCRGENQEHLSADAGDVVLVVNFFGLDDSSKRERFARSGAELIEDHTHDPWSEWSWTSEADWCVASFRKTLPVPDGAVLWSPRRHVLPAVLPPARWREEASAKRLAAMLLKRRYLEGAPVSKDDFRTLYRDAEDTLRMPELSGMTTWSAAILRSLPVERMRAVRLENQSVFSTELQDEPDIELLQPADRGKSCPFSCVLVFSSADLRERVRHKLVNARVYGAVLWPLDAPALGGVPVRHRRLSRHLLSLHCDARYSASDMTRVAGLIRGFLRDCRDR